MPWTFVVIVALAIVVGSAAVLWGSQRSRPLPDYADPDVEDLSLEAFLAEDARGVRS